MTRLQLFGVWIVVIHLVWLMVVLARLPAKKRRRANESRRRATANALQQMVDGT